MAALSEDEMRWGEERKRRGSEVGSGNKVSNGRQQKAKVPWVGTFDW